MIDPGSRAESADTGILVRAFRAIELLVSAHARLVRLEARNDLGRIVSALVLAAVGLTLLSFALILAHAAAVFAVERRFQWGIPASLGAVAGADVFVAMILLLVARARLARPVLTDTRAMVAKATALLRP